MNQVPLTDICSVFAFSNKKRKIFSNPFIAYAYYKTYRINLSSGLREDFSLLDLEKRLNEIKLKQSYKYPYVFHFFYELGFYFLGLGDLINDDQLLAIELLYHEVDDYIGETKKIFLKKESAPDFNEYQKLFKEGFAHLLKGNCYQFNLTSPYCFKSESMNLDHLLSYFWAKMTPAYAHATQIPLLKRQYVSNSPECLFQAKEKNDKYCLWTMPIKGTTHFSNNDSFEEKWDQLSQCQKNGAELDMITDLLRNDLSAIEFPTAKVIKRRAPLVVPSILHQYSLIEVNLSNSISLGKILKALFPGGSITGAPKKKVMEILKGLEGRARGFYCGSTVLFYENIRAASINIRSLEIDTVEENICYQAGGGITLQSECEAEFREMELKVTSFFGK